MPVPASKSSRHSLIFHMNVHCSSQLCSLVLTSHICNLFPMYFVNKLQYFSGSSLFIIFLQTCKSAFYAFFWLIPRRLNCIGRRFGTLCLFHLHRQVGMKYTSYLRREITQKKANIIQSTAKV